MRHFTRFCLFTAFLGCFATMPTHAGEDVGVRALPSVGLESRVASAAEFRLAVGDYAPAFSLRAYNEQISLEMAKSPSVSLHNFVGFGAEFPKKAAIVAFCSVVGAGAEQDIRTLQKLAKKYEDDGLVVTLISIDQADVRDIYKVLDTENVTFPVLRDRFKIVSMRYGVENFPTIFVVDSEGKIEAVGLSGGPELEKALSKSVMSLIAR